MSGSFYALSELTAPWGLYLPPMGGLEGCVWFHVPIARPLPGRGRAASLRSSSRPAISALVPHGQGHTLRSEPEVDAPNILDLERTLLGDRYEFLRYGGGGRDDPAHLRAVRFEHPAARNLTDLLPPVARAALARAAVANGWIQSTMRLIDAEAAEPKPGGEAVITRLSDILVIQAIRHWLEHDPGAKVGWLGAIQDPQIGRALTPDPPRPRPGLDPRLPGPRGGYVALRLRRAVQPTGRRGRRPIPHALAHASRRRGASGATGHRCRAGGALTATAPRPPSTVPSSASSASHPARYAAKRPHHPPRFGYRASEGGTALSAAVGSLGTA